MNKHANRNDISSATPVEPKGVPPPQLKPAIEIPPPAANPDRQVEQAVGHTKSDKA